MGKIGFLYRTSWIGTSSSSTSWTFIIRTPRCRWSLGVRKGLADKNLDTSTDKRANNNTFILFLFACFNLFYSLKKRRLPIEPPEWVVLLLFQTKKPSLPARKDDEKLKRTHRPFPHHRFMWFRETYADILWQVLCKYPEVSHRPKISMVVQGPAIRSVVDWYPV
jgi:hypothetical protein